MWATLVVMAIALSIEPVRIGLTVLMLNRPRPMVQLLTFLCGGFAMGFGVNLVVLFVLSRMVVATPNFNLAKVQIVTGLLVVPLAVILAIDIPVPKFMRRRRTGATVGGDAGPRGDADPVVAAPSAWERLSTRARHILLGSSLWVAGISGVGIALPSAQYAAAIAVIVASGATPAARAAALLMFNIVAFAFVEIPLASYLVAPDKTRAAIARLNAWIRSRHRRDFAALLGASGCIVLAMGLSGL